jgi:hypothetical protein
VEVFWLSNARSTATLMVSANVERIFTLHSPAIGPVVQLVLFQPHPQANQNDFAPVRAECDADVVVGIVRPSGKELLKCWYCVRRMGTP